MEGFEGQPPSALIARFWAPGWNSVQSVNKFQAEIGHGLRDGDPGRRLVEPSKERTPVYFNEIPEPFAPREDIFLLTAMYHLFGSDELSVLTPGIRDRCPEPYVALSGTDMSRLGLKEGEAATIIVDGQAYRLLTRLSPGLAPRVAGVSSGVPGSPVLGLPTWARVEKA
jgi:NADH-quinone oxidoreductase subunit G